MKLFSRLFAELDRSTATLAKVDALKRYFAAAAPRDAAWAVYFLAGGKPRQVVPSGVLWAPACRRAGIDDWLFDACYQAVGDFAETVAHVLPPAGGRATSASPSGSRIASCRCAASIRRSRRARRLVLGRARHLGRFLLNKLIGGGFRVGVSKLLVQRALAEGAGIDAKLVAQRMMGYTDGRATPSAERYAQLTASGDVGPLDVGQPYPFFLAHQLDLPDSEFAPARRARDWSSSGSTTASARQVSSAPAGLDLVARRGARQRALSRDRRARQRVAERHRPRRRDRRLEGRPRRAVQPAAAAHRPQDDDEEGAGRRAGRLHRYDLLEWRGEDLRERPQHERRALLEAALAARAVADTDAADGGCASRRSSAAPTGPSSPRCGAARAPAASRA
jgi:DNA ligase-1